MLHTKTQMWCAWSGVVGVTLFFLSFWPFAQWIPPPGPYLTQAEVAAMYQQHTNGIRIGMIFMLISSAFSSPLAAVIFTQLKRIEGEFSLMAYTQFSAGTAGIVTFFLPAIMFLVTAFRPERPAELTYLMNDLSWILLVIAFPTFVMQYAAIGVAILKDKRPDPIFPRWLAFFNFWVALLLLPAALLPFFKTGPFAWNGLLVFWVPGTVFTAWYITMLVLLLKAIKRQAREAMV